MPRPGESTLEAGQLTLPETKVTHPAMVRVRAAHADRCRCEIDPQAQHCFECIAECEMCSWDLPPLDTFLNPPHPTRATSELDTSDSDDDDDSGESSHSASRQTSATTVDTPFKPRNVTYAAHRSGPSPTPLTTGTRADGQAPHPSHTSSTRSRRCQLAGSCPSTAWTRASAWSGPRGWTGTSA